MRMRAPLAGSLAAAFAIGLAFVKVPALDRLARPALTYFAPAVPTDLTRCAGQYPANARPAYVHKGVDRSTTTICYPSFSIGYSGLTRTPLWAAEKLTAANVIAAKGGRPDEPFHPDEHLAGRDRAQLDDYRAGYDRGFSRGHMAPSGDMPSYAAKVDSFTLANIVPQDRRMNAELWNDIEQATRQLAKRRAAIFVVTGPVFEGAQLDALNGRVAIPSAIYKAVMIPGDGAAAYVAPNRDGYRYTIVSIAELTRRTGIDPFPSLDARARASAIELPRPRARHRRRSRDETL